MQDMIAYTVAVFVAVMIMFMLFSLRVRSDETSVQVTQYYAAKDRSLDLSTLLERDLRNLSSNLTSRNCAGGSTFFPLDPDTAVVNFDTTATTRFFQFYGLADTCATNLSVIRYEWVQNGTVTLGGGTVENLYDVTRKVDGVTKTSYPGLVTRLSFDLMQGDGNGIFNLADTRQIGVEMHLVSPLGSGDMVEKVRWNTIIHPYGMTRNDWGF